MQGFFQKTKKTEETPARRLARETAELIESQGRMIKRASLARWEEEITLLLKDESEEDVRLCLDWMRENKGESPVIYSAKGLRLKFTEIKRLALKDRPEEPAETSQDALYVLRYLNEDGDLPPALENQDLAGVVERSLNEYEGFWRGVKDAARQDKGGHLLRSMLDSGFLDTPREFVLWWIKLALQEMNWRMRKHGFGRLDYLAWSAEHPVFDRVACDKALEASGSVSAWRTLLREVKR